MLEKIAFVLFYGIMALVAATCFIQLGTLRVWTDANWFSAWGSWASGIGTFVAAGAALYVSGKDRRDRKAERDQETRYKQHFSAYQVLRFCEDLTGHLEKMDIGTGINPTTWTVLRALEKSVPKIEGLPHPADVPGIVVLGLLYEEAVDLDREIIGHNVLCDQIHERQKIETAYEVFLSMHEYLKNMHTRTERLGQKLAALLNGIYGRAEFPTDVPLRSLRLKRFIAAGLAPDIEPEPPV